MASQIPPTEHPAEEPRSRPLTPRQREILLRAVHGGYYEYPRRITLTDLAREIGIAKSTLSESLIMIERTVMQSFARTLEPPPQPRVNFTASV